jgi:hypothetical protein
MKGRGINNLPEFLDSSPSPQPSPIKGEEVFFTFYEFIHFNFNFISAIFAFSAVRNI